MIEPSWTEDISSMMGSSMFSMNISKIKLVPKYKDVNVVDLKKKYRNLKG